MLGVLALALPLHPTAAAFTAQIVNNTNTVGAGTLTIEEKNLGDNVTCRSKDGANNAVTCSINKYGGKLNMKPGETVITDITLTNTGTLPANDVTIRFGDCIQDTSAATLPTLPSGTICAKYSLTLAKSGSAGLTASLNATPGKSYSMRDLFKLQSLNPGESLPLTFKLTLVDDDHLNGFQGISLRQAITFDFTA